MFWINMPRKGKFFKCATVSSWTIKWCFKSFSLYFIASIQSCKANVAVQLMQSQITTAMMAVQLLQRALDNLALTKFITAQCAARIQRQQRVSPNVKHIWQWYRISLCVRASDLKGRSSFTGILQSVFFRVKLVLK